MVRVTGAPDEPLRRRLRHAAEDRRKTGRASVRAVILQAFHQLCAQDQGRTSRIQHSRSTGFDEDARRRAGRPPSSSTPEMPGHPSKMVRRSNSTLGGSF